MICDKCGKLVNDTFRVNKKGEDGIFWCKKCCVVNKIDIDPDLEDTIDILKRDLGDNY